jgi:hypothetical protein
MGITYNILHLWQSVLNLYKLTLLTIKIFNFSALPPPLNISIAKITSYFLAILGLWTQGLALARQAPYYLSHDFRHFCFKYFSDKVSWVLPRPALEDDPSAYTFCITGIRSINHIAWLVFILGVLLSFFIGYLQGVILIFSLPKQLGLLYPANKLYLYIIYVSKSLFCTFVFQSYIE